MKRSISLAILVAMLLTFLVPATVGAQTPEKYEAYETGHNADVHVYGAYWYAQTFTPDEAFSITSVRLRIARVGDPGPITVSIRRTDGGDPVGSDLTSYYFEVGFWAGVFSQWYEINLPTRTLGTETYAIVVRAPAGDDANYLRWYYHDVGTYAGGMYLESDDSGLTWSDEADYDFMFSIWGYPVFEVLDAKVFSGYLEQGDWLIAVRYLNEYPEYFGLEDISDLFELQLVVGNTTFASVRPQLWGNMPGSIYLSKALADVLEWGSPYQVRLVGRFDPYPAVNKTLLAADWMGEDLTRLDRWVKTQARVMQTFYGETMIVYLTDQEKLGEAGSVFFAIGIPLLAGIRPHLFLHPEMYLPVSQADWDRLYEESFVWQDLLGVQISTDADYVGGFFGLEALQAVQTAFFGTWVIVAGGLAVASGTVAIVASGVFLLIGFLAGIIPLTFFAILASLFVLAFVYMVWIRGS